MYKYLILLLLLNGCGSIPTYENYDVREFVCSGPVDNPALRFECQKFFVERHFIGRGVNNP